MWKRLAVSGDVPSARSSHAIISCGDHVYLFGGEQQPRVTVENELYKLNIMSSIWTKCNTDGVKPRERFGHCMASVGQKLYLFGGRSGVAMGEGSFNDMFYVDTGTMTWKEVKVTGEVPIARSYAAMTSFGTNLYLFGGCQTDGRFNDLHRFDTITNKWFKLPSSDDITPRGGPGLVTDGEYLYIIAGFTGVEVDDAHRFNLSTNTWEKLTLKPNIPPISVFAIAAWDKSILLFGGERVPSTEGHSGAGEFTNDMYILKTDRMDLGWQKMSTEGDVPCPRGWFPMTYNANKGYIVVFGGNTGSNTRAADSYIFAM